MSSTILKPVASPSKAIAILVIILSCAFIAAGVLQYTYNVSNKVDTNNWNLYTNTVCGYSFKYPKRWTIREQVASTTSVACDRVYLISPNNPRRFDVLGSAEYSFMIWNLEALFPLFPEFSSLHRNASGSWEGIQAEINNVPRIDALDRAIFRDMWGIQNLTSGLVSKGQRSYIILLTPAEGGHTIEDLTTFNGVLVSFQIH